jgi:CxxC motif-containing protein (DUF1111 family)
MRGRGRALLLAAGLLAGGPALAQGHPDSALPADRRLDVRLGEAVFGKLWASAPASTKSSDGLGPLFNARSCQSCHFGGGRGRPAAVAEEAPLSLLFRLSIPPRTAQDRALLASGRAGTIPDPLFGQQLQPFAVQGLPAEPRIAIDWSEHPVTLADGLVVTLRRPAYRAAAQPGLAPGTMLSPRLAPSLAGIGLLAAIPEAAILAGADPDDADGDGIRGRPNRAWSLAEGGSRLGRFGWKAAEPGLPDQVATAFSLDLGLSTPLLPEPWGDCTEAQSLCRGAPHGLAAGEETEVSQSLFDLVVLYLRNLAAPARRPAGVPRGEAVFAAAGCAACHRHAFTLADGRRVAPFSDLLLHDMGEGLADHRPDWQAGGRDWRTAPLWGLGSRPAGTALLHDGRARSPLEAILWHGGEAGAARDRVLGLSTADREALLAFLESL